MHSARQSFLSYYSFSNTRKRKAMVVVSCGRAARRAAPSRGVSSSRGHGKQGFQLGGGHGDGSLHLPLINGAEAGYSTCCTGFL